MPTVAFKEAKKIGRWFEAQVRDVLREVGKEKGIELIDSEKLKYRDKRGWDCEVRLRSGARCKVEVKYDERSEATGNVAIEPLAVGHSISPIWIYGLPYASRIDLYAMFLADLKEYAYQYYKAHPGAIRRAGEFGDWVILVPKWEFVSQSFVRKLKTINLN